MSYHSTYKGFDIWRVKPRGEYLPWEATADIYDGYTPGGYTRTLRADTFNGIKQIITSTVEDIKNEGSRIITRYY